MMMWTRLGPLGAAVILVAGVGVHQGLEPRGTGGGLAERMLDAAIVPAGATRVSALAGSAFAQPSEEPACTPLTDDVRYWKVPGSAADVAAFLAAHTPDWLTKDGTGSLVASGGEQISFSISDAPKDARLARAAELDLTVAALPGGMTGIRADAEVPAANATCATSGGPVHG
jgi:hypothetical protein